MCTTIRAGARTFLSASRPAAARVHGRLRVRGVVRGPGGGLDGGADRNRTCDLLIANETLCQLSYDPVQYRSNNGGKSGWRKSKATPRRLT